MRKSGNQCCAYNCTQTYKKDSGISFHKFPKDPTRRQLWVLSLRRANFKPSEYSRICSLHFTEESFDREKFGGRWLKQTAIPTIFDFPEHIRPIEILKISEKRTLSPDQSTSKIRIVDSNLLYQESDEEPDDLESASCSNTFKRQSYKEDLSDASPFYEESVETDPALSNVRLKRLSYIGDFKDDVINDSPSTMQKRWAVAKEVIAMQKKKIKYLQKRNRTLEKKVADFSLMFKEFKTKKLTNDKAKDIIKVYYVQNDSLVS